MDELHLKLRYRYPEDQIFNPVTVDISFVLGESPPTISDSIETGSPVEAKIVRVVSLCTTEITKDGNFSKNHVKRKDPIVPKKISPLKKSGWFCNSFDSKQEQCKRSTTSLEVNACDQLITSSTKVKTQKAEYAEEATIDEAGDLDTSDMLMADLDLENVSPQLVPNISNCAQNAGSLENCVNGKSALKSINRFQRIASCNDLEKNQLSASGKSDSCHLDTTDQMESPYFVSKFKNYIPTQGEKVKNEDSKDLYQTGDRSKVPQNTLENLKEKSMFSFSFVGNDTVCDEPDDSVVFGSPVKRSRKTARKMWNLTKSSSTDEQDLSTNKLEWCPGHFETSTQVANNHLIKNVAKNQVNVMCKLQLVQNPSKVYSNSENSQLDISVMTQESMANEADITQLKDRTVTVKYRCTPYKRQESHNESCTQISTPTQTQCSLVLTPVTCKSTVQSQNKDMDIERSSGKCIRLVSQCDIQPTPICDMTGLIVDSQSEEAGQMGPRCDTFDDSFHDPDLLTQIEKMDEEYSQKLYSQASGSEEHAEMKNIDITSHTQSLVVGHKSSNNKRTFEDDIGDIFNASQKRRNQERKKSRLASASDRMKCCSVKNTESVIENIDFKVNSKSVVLIPDKKNVGSTGSISFKEKKPNYSITDGTVIYGSKGKSAEKAVTPGGGSLQDKIKQRLKNNAVQITSNRPMLLVDQLREQVLERAQLEAEMVKGSVTNDIGPFYGLPSKVKDLLAQHRGITSLYEWQDECLNLPAVQSRKNLIYSLPTSGGKTLVAEILILQELLCQKRDALLILPFVSIVQEKVRNMSQLAVDLNFYVEEYAASKGRFPPTKHRKSRSLFIATIEKAHSIVNSLIEEERLDSLGLVVVDELHMIGEGGSRGAAIESTLIKLLHASGPTQVVGMSATLSNIEDLQKFMNADVYSNDFRPVKLTENIKISDSIYRIDQTANCTEDRFIHERIVCFQYNPDMEKMDPNHLLGLTLEVIPQNSCLIFCPTKKNCESVALMLCKMLVKMKSELSSVKRSERKQLLKELYNDADGKICPVLQYTLHFGVAYHHSGLTTDERKLIEEAYAASVLCLLTCTSTLAAGVNLPAKRVILKSPYVGKSFITRSQYKQMVGRAGRAGIDTTGESILICQQSDREKVCELLDRPVEKCHSSLLYNGGKGIRTFLLSAIGLKITSTTEDVFQLMGRSLMKLQESVLNVDVNKLVQESLQKLIDNGLVKQIKSHCEDPETEDFVHSLEVTELGKATFKGPIDPDFAGMLYEDLKKDECLVISTHLHLLYLVTPYDLVEDVVPSWAIYHNQMSTLNSAELKVASIIGVTESYITMKASLQRPRKKLNEFIVKRFYLTLMLYDLWCQRTVWEVAEKFELHRGFIQNLLTSAASFASCVAHFCQEMSEFWAYQDLMGNFVKRLSYCVTAELIPLMEIPGIKMGRARLMYNAGYRTLSSVATCDVEQLVKNVQYMPRKTAKQIIASAKLLLNEKAEAMIEEVEELVAIPTNIVTNQPTTAIQTPMPLIPGQSQGSIESLPN